MPALDRRTTGTAGLLVVVLFAYTIQTQLTSYVQHSLGYRKPFFLFYLTHSGYLALLPAHVLALKLGGSSLRTAFRGLREILAHHFRAPSLLDHDGLPTSPKLSRSDGGAYRVSAPVRLAQLVLPRSWAVELEEDWVARLARKTLILTVFISAPALSWYAAVPLTSMTDITAIYNVFAFWAYLLSLYYLPSAHPESPLVRYVNLFAVVLAVGGVFVIAYGDATGGDEEAQNRLVGNCLTLFASIVYAGYEVWYKLHIALPEPSYDTPLDQIEHRSAQRRVPSPLAAANDHDEADDDDLGAAIDDLDAASTRETSSLLASPADPSLATHMSTPSHGGAPAGSAAGGGSGAASAAQYQHHSRHPSGHLPFTRPDHPSRASSRRSTGPPQASPGQFLLYSNFITSLIGFCTLVLFWVGIPILHVVGWEEFEKPPEGAIGVLVGIIASGVVFNGGFMLLISLLGPVIASVANLLTLLLVSAADALFVPDAPPITRSTLVGGGMIVGAFAGLIWGEVRSRKDEGAGGGGGAEGRGEGKEGRQRTQRV
ncbi:hypothetical protein Rhopal_006558-T1 [Rhodotorula paludigena]|uniref:EamA domain-containing protein n=1 Tax=Rhodotorula paludigena TaxID=86838 RepID=A0AAV5GMJ2_9BASI|nr:hypothetical protein Rhopal_006558-T1 [Rhodotorula paludigena]